MAAMENTSDTTTPWFLKVTRPVDFQSCDCINESQEDFDAYVARLLRKDEPPTPASFERQADGTAIPNASFMEGLSRFNDRGGISKIQSGGLVHLTDNGDVTNATSDDALVDLFHDASDAVSGESLDKLLTDAWAEDPLITLKLIFNCRSIHLGKSNKELFYRCAGWLASNHPRTLLANLPWLTRPIIAKKAEKKEAGEGDEDIVLVDAPEDDTDMSRFDVQHGVSHGYWKDLLNILVLAANDELTVTADVKAVFNVDVPAIRRAKMKRRGLDVKPAASAPKRISKVVAMDAANGTERNRRAKRLECHAIARERFAQDPFYRCLHTAVTRLFVHQLRDDLALLSGDDHKAKQGISMCAKWAPSDDLLHDRNTVIVSSIAEGLFPRDCFGPELNDSDSRTTYLRHARERYRKSISTLRKYLDVVERKITAKELDKIRYQKVPSVAMNNYKGLFIDKDFDRFLEYINALSSGKTTTSGAILLPSTLVSAVRKMRSVPDQYQVKGMSQAKMIEACKAVIDAKLLSAQWDTLVKRIKESGSLESCIAVCDVSGSMTWPARSDGSTPMDSAIGLSLLMAEVTKAPFGGGFITFDYRPSFVRVKLSDSLKEKVEVMERSPWGGSTNLVSAFTKLILPMAITNKVAPEDMVKRVFVFSDMHFNSATDSGPWKSSYERIVSAFQEAGYEMPELVFWNLADSSTNWGNSNADEKLAKPVTAADKGTALVSGYSQAMLKVFMEGGGFEDEEEEEEENTEDSDDDMAIIDNEGNEQVKEEKKEKAEKTKLDPLSLVKRAVSHKAYQMLKVVD
ncbi:hypothetical protein VHEMI09378 [[Torrubiella] hemipterigena]|uniref:DUF2828 domain-containing protein n=1 Tax=[Torrubiella] hemipterigena TaxID=1531966 RepID=A0A0A1TPY0_9HYPO|nr:hypothetical protein VHEMI09378 [[Torrubiella] hemipterigena]